MNVCANIFFLRLIFFFFLEKLLHIEGLKTGHFPRLKAGVKFFFFYPYFDKKKLLSF